MFHTFVVQTMARLMWKLIEWSTNSGFLPLFWSDFQSYACRGPRLISVFSNWFAQRVNVALAVKVRKRARSRQRQRPKTPVKWFGGVVDHARKKINVTILFTSNYKIIRNFLN
jgi:hypothetical protein